MSDATGTVTTALYAGGDDDAISVNGWGCIAPSQLQRSLSDGQTVGTVQATHPFDSVGFNPFDAVEAVANDSLADRLSNDPDAVLWPGQGAEFHVNDYRTARHDAPHWGATNFDIASEAEWPGSADWYQFTGVPSPDTTGSLGWMRDMQDGLPSDVAQDPMELGQYPVGDLPEEGQMTYQLLDTGSVPEISGGTNVACTICQHHPHEHRKPL